jgi:hypothetical protein
MANFDDFPCKFPVIREISHFEHSSLVTASTTMQSTESGLSFMSGNFLYIPEAYVAVAC